ncbi:MAG: PQQ-dependent sugar dehydrogenase [Acidobacteria bacterium]|nr:PQQ-dependent sugar dehydrogenase [Acidobacteriota bacterium]
MIHHPRATSLFAFLPYALLLTAAPASAQLRAQIVVAGFASPVAIVPDPVTPNVFFVVEQGGLVHAVQNGTRLPTPFLDLSTIVTATPRGERGLLGMAFPLDAASGRVFVNFTNRDGPGHTVIARFHRTPGNPLVADPGSRFDLMWPDAAGLSPFIRQPYENHKGGNLAFGPDGFLYIGLGDGGSGNDPQNRAQDPQALLGKMLRIDVGVDDTDQQGYRIPAGNPFATDPTVLDEIWASGYRNPWRYSFDDFGAGATGGLIAGDVGQGSREEIDYEPAGRGGRNYGWSIFEGNILTPGVSGRTPRSAVTPPIADYDRSIGTAVTGGYVYRGTILPPQYRGRYFLSDSGTGRVFSLGLAYDSAGEARVAEYVEHTAELGSTVGVSTFGRGLDGELYFARFNGTIYRISGPAPPPPTNLQSTVSGSAVTVSWTPGAGSSPASTYQIEVGSQPGSSNLLVSQTSQTAFAANGVVNGTYYVRVRAANAGGLSVASGEIIVNVGCVVGLSAPTGYMHQVGPSFASLSWNPVSGAAGYRVEAGSGPGLANLGTFLAQSPALAGQVVPGTYYARVRAFNACGVGAATADRVITVP